MDEKISVKQIILYVPIDSQLPTGYDEWTPDDTELILSIGSIAVNHAKLGFGPLHYREVAKDMEFEYKKRYEESVQVFKDRAEKAEKEAHFQSERVRLSEENEESQIQRRLKQSKEVFDNLLESYRKEREDMQARISQLERENDKTRESSRRFQQDMEQRAQKEALTLVSRELESMRQMLKEKDKQVDTHKELFERSITKVDNLTQKRDVASIGKIGEGQFKSLATNVFRDFDGFQLKEVCSIGGLGDFHLHFKEMTILVDSKLYTNKVNSTSRDKIRRDLLNNDHIAFAWLVSMDTFIDRFDKAPFMFEWVNPQKCICYINNLRGQEEPGELLRAVWYCCKSLQQMMTNDANEKGELSVLKEREMKMRDILEKLVKSNRERDTLLTQFRQNFDKSDEYIREMLNVETDVIVNQYYRVVVDWWNDNLEETKSSVQIPIKSTLLWTQFKRNMGDQIGDIDANTFKDILCGFLGEDKVIKPKTKGGALELIGVKWKDGLKLR
jgi:hypothetical protein